MIYKESCNMKADKLRSGELAKPQSFNILLKKGHRRLLRPNDFNKIFCPRIHQFYVSKSWRKCQDLNPRDSPNWSGIVEVMAEWSVNPWVNPLSQWAYSKLDICWSGLTQEQLFGNCLKNIVKMLFLCYLAGVQALYLVHMNFLFFKSLLLFFCQWEKLHAYKKGCVFQPKWIKNSIF